MSLPIISLNIYQIGHRKILKQRGSRNKLISHLFYNFIINPLTAALSNPCQRGSPGGGGVFIYGNHAARRENGTSWWGWLCDVYFARKKSSERVFFVPAGTHLAVKLLRFFWATQACTIPHSLTKSSIYSYSAIIKVIFCQLEYPLPNAIRTVSIWPLTVLKCIQCNKTQSNPT